MKRSALLLSIVLISASTSAYAASAPKPGSKCTEIGATRTLQGKTYTCVKDGKKKVWSKGTSSKSETTTATPSPTPTPSKTSAIDVSWFPSTIKIPETGDLINIPLPAVNATDGDLVTKTTSQEIKLPPVSLTWRQKTQLVGDIEAKYDLYSTSDKTFLTEFNIYTWNVKKGERSRLGWAGPWVGTYGDKVFPSASRFVNYFLMIFPEELVLYQFPKFIPNYESAEDYAIARIPRDEAKVNAVTLDDYKARSKDLAAGVEKLIKMGMDRSPSQNYALKYTGHGAGQGGLFEVVVRRGDARSLLKSLVTYNGGRKFVYFDAGTNCDESSLTTLDDVAPYFDYFLGSQFERGGGEVKCTSSLLPCWNNLENSLMFPTIHPFQFSNNLTFAQSLTLMARLNQLGWSWVTEKQSLTLVDLARYMIFRSALNAAITDNPIPERDLEKYASTSPLPASTGIKYNNYDLGKLISLKYPQLTNLWKEMILTHVTTQVYSGIDWEASGIYFHSYDVGAFSTNFYYDADYGGLFARQ